MSCDCLVIMRKDLEEVLRNRYIVSSMASFPLVFSVAIPLICLLTVPSNVTVADVAMFRNAVPGFEAMEPRQIVVYFLVQSNLPFYLLMPGIMPTLIASYSIAGEKKGGTLEPLLATPASSFDILLGKTMAAVLPSVLITWLSFLIYAMLVNHLARGLFGHALLPDALWLIALFVTAPLVAVLSVYTSVLVSSRMTDVRAAQQVSAVLVVPIMGLFILQLFGMISLSVGLLALMSGGLLLLDGVLIKAGAAVFQREEILTRWG